MTPRETTESRATSPNYGFGGESEHEQGQAVHRTVAERGYASWSEAEGEGGTDNEVRTRIGRAIEEACPGEGSTITVDVKGGEVTLTGVVSQQALRYELENLVSKIAGVKDVENQLTVQ